MNKLFSKENKVEARKVAGSATYIYKKMNPYETVFISVCFFSLFLPLFKLTSIDRVFFVVVVVVFFAQNIH